MFQGSAQVKGNGHFELVQGAGGSLNGTTSFERTNYFETMPAHQLELALWLEADRMGSLLAALDEESLQNQRDVVKNERRQRYDNVPYGTAFERMTALAYPEGHPYHHIPIGSMADLDAVTLEDARAFFRANYAPNNAVLAVVGDIDPEQTRSMGREVLRLHPALRRQGAAPRRCAPRHHRRGAPGGDPRRRSRRAR